jgi:2-keto-4-pentenoate hydratase
MVSERLSARMRAGRSPDNRRPDLAVGTSVSGNSAARREPPFGGAIQGWQAGLAGIVVRLEVDGVEIRRGSGADVMGDPILPLHWLAEERRRFGDGLQAGETVSTGSMTGMLPVRAGQRVRARFGELAEVAITFDA